MRARGRQPGTIAHHTAPTVRSGFRRVEVLRAGWGLALLLAPRTVLRGVFGAQDDPRAVGVARVLGARHLTQGALSGIRPSPEVLAMGVWVDCVHSVTAVGLALADPPRARAALTDAAAAACWSAAGRHDLSVGTAATDAGRQQGRDRLARAVLRAVPGGHRLLADVNRDERNHA